MFVPSVSTSLYDCCALSIFSIVAGLKSDAILYGLTKALLAYVEPDISVVIILLSTFVGSCDIKTL